VATVWAGFADALVAGGLVHMDGEGRYGEHEEDEGERS